MADRVRVLALATRGAVRARTAIAQETERVVDRPVAVGPVDLERASPPVCVDPGRRRVHCGAPGRVARHGSIVALASSPPPGTWPYLTGPHHDHRPSGGTEGRGLSSSAMTLDIDR